MRQLDQASACLGRAGGPCGRARALISLARGPVGRTTRTGTLAASSVAPGRHFPAPATSSCHPSGSGGRAPSRRQARSAGEILKFGSKGPACTWAAWRRSSGARNCGPPTILTRWRSARARWANGVRPQHFGGLFGRQSPLARPASLLNGIRWCMGAARADPGPGVKRRRALGEPKRRRHHARARALSLPGQWRPGGGAAPWLRGPPTGLRVCANDARRLLPARALSILHTQADPVWPGATRCLLS